MLKETLVFDSDDEYRLTGTETRPKEIVAVPIERAGIRVGQEKEMEAGVSLASLGLTAKTL